MDWVAVDAESRRSLVKQFKARFPSWQKQRKLGIQFDDVRELSNKYLNYLETL